MAKNGSKVNVLTQYTQGGTYWPCRYPRIFFTDVCFQKKDSDVYKHALSYGYTEPETKRTGKRISYRQDLAEAWICPNNCQCAEF